MASESAMDRHNVPHRDYRGVEGKTVSVPHKGLVRILSLIYFLAFVLHVHMLVQKIEVSFKCATFVRVIILTIQFLVRNKL